ncbi:hypothetical protein Nepgr_014496 [Nepenthes gracilis]|uniref:DUF868 domain-containing protein n=1 Tax=Nepenthes gracilis TaxID=150966 RepID=A0AAD3SKY6_NEPGR|nr:hypothetical protein Nepgr_014496 [Nepenthes gracilis]
MRDVISCFSEHAVRVHETACSSFVSQSCISQNLTPSIRNAVACQYKVILSSQNHLLVTLTWCRNHKGQGLAITIDDDPSTSFKLQTFSRLFSKKKGSKSVEYNGFKIDISWDLSSAAFDSGPEPVDGYFLLLTVDSELALVLGNLAHEAASKKIKNGATVAKFSLISRREHCSGNALYSTKAQFCDTGAAHDILIRCVGVNERIKQPVLSVSIDNRTVMRVKRLEWNFRGNQTIFVDGLLVDLLWDVHDWFFNPASGFAVFMFRTRSGMDSRLWLEEKAAQKEKETIEFSLLIYASKTP